MKEETIYCVGNRAFSSKEEASKYEQSLKDDLKLRARNLFLFWIKMLGYPGQAIAIELVNNFAGNRKLWFGQYKGNYIGEIIFLDKQYIKWCLDNIPFFKLNNMEQILFDTSQKIDLGGSITEFGNGICESYDRPGETYDSELINLEISWID